MTLAILSLSSLLSALVVLAVSAACYAAEVADWPQEGFDFGWNDPLFPLAVPITGHCNTINVTWFRGTDVGPFPQAPYIINLYSSTSFTPSVLDAGNGTSKALQIPFSAGAQYVLCMTDSSSVSGGCSDLYTVYPSSNTCPNVSSPVTSLDLNMTSDSGVLLSRYGWPTRGSDILFNPINGSSPYTLSIIPASGTPLNSTFQSTARWTVSLEPGQAFFVSVIDSRGISWINGPMHVAYGTIAGAFAASKYLWLTLPVSLAMSFSFLILGLLVAGICVWMIARRRYRPLNPLESEKVGNTISDPSPSPSSQTIPTTHAGASSNFNDGLTSQTITGSATVPILTDVPRRRLSKRHGEISQMSDMPGTGYIDIANAGSAKHASAVNITAAPPNSSNVAGKGPRTGIPTDTGYTKQVTSLEHTTRHPPIVTTGGLSSPVNYCDSSHNMNDFTTAPLISNMVLDYPLPRTATVRCTAGIATDRIPAVNHLRLTRDTIPVPDPNRTFLPKPYKDIVPGTYPDDEQVFGVDLAVSFCHIMIVMDRSSSMRGSDRKPPKGEYDTVAKTHDNRYGAAIAATHEFIRVTKNLRRARHGSLRDAYSCILFSSEADEVFTNDVDSDADTLLDTLIENKTSYGTNFKNALKKAEALMKSHWSKDRLPVVIFLSDGETNINNDEAVRDICNASVLLGKPLAFYTVSFGNERESGSLTKMANIAAEVYKRAAPPGAKIPCEYKMAPDFVRLGNTLLDLAKQMAPHDSVYPNLRKSYPSPLLST